MLTCARTATNISATPGALEPVTGGLAIEKAFAAPARSVSVLMFELGSQWRHRPPREVHGSSASFDSSWGLDDQVGRRGYVGMFRVIYSA